MAFLIALIPTILFSVEQLLMGAFPTGPRRQNTAVLAGGGLISVLASPMLGGGWSLRGLLLGVLAGLAWSCGQVLILRAFQSWGVSRSMPVIASGQIILNALAGITLLGEWRAPGALPLGLAALVVIMAGACACAWVDEKDHAVAGHTDMRLTPAQVRTGLLSSLACCVLYGIYPPMLQLGGVSSRDALAPMGIGLLLGAAVCAAILPREQPLVGRGSAAGAAAGASWAVGNVALLMAAESVGVATAMPLSQLSFALSAIGGIVLLGERRNHRESLATGIGLVLAVLGVLLLGLANAC